ncbi:hypothetical protein [Bradyrhizobium sp. Tv2a-2]|uniref:hypothetical protein n=1 Tax=Bradyrhizobium sp. Tv2a-2 TaxID=113395 RepID=UPI0003FA9CCB|nr:hypothetical protein [Bradyrhizobium sp. Tv2a-2]
MPRKKGDPKVGEKGLDRDRRLRRGKRTTKTSTTSPRSIEFRKKAAEALEYRKMGYTFEKIGEEMGFDGSYAYRLIKWSMDNMVAEPLEDLRKMMRVRIEEMMVGVLDKAFAGDVEAQEQVRRNMELQAKLDGLFAPNKVEHSGEVGGGNPVFILSPADAKL